MNVMEYIYPELLFIVPFLNIIGWWIKHETVIANNLIPLILGVVSIILSVVYIYSSMGMSFLKSVGAGVVQGIFLAASAVYANQLTKTGKEEEE